MWRRTAGRWRRAMSALAVVEHRSTALPSVLRWRQFTVSGSAAYQPAALTASPSPTGTGLPAKIAPAEPPAATPLTAPVAADAVVIGKFDRGRQARMRAFYSAEGLCARVQAAAPRAEREHGVSRSVRAAQVVSPHRPGLIPLMVDHGTVLGGRTAYLVEKTVHGHNPTDPTQVAEAMAAVATELGVVQDAVGVTAAKLSAVVSPRFLERWGDLVDAKHVPRRLAAAVDKLIAKDDHLEVSFTHGDLVTSNVLRTDRGIVLIDWEYAGFAPIAFDLAKMHVNSGPAGPALEVLADALGERVGHRSGHYPLVEQLALAHVVVLSRLEARVRRAKAAQRMEPLRRQTHKRVAALGALMALDA